MKTGMSLSDFDHKSTETSRLLESITFSRCKVSDICSDNGIHKHQTNMEDFTFVRSGDKDVHAMPIPETFKTDIQRKRKRILTIAKKYFN